MKKQKVIVLFGGVSSEHEVSRMSATSVLRNLDCEKYEVLPVGITKAGRWFLYTGDIAAIQSGAWEKGDCTPVSICPGSGVHGLIAFENGSCRAIEADVVFPVLHGKNGEDGTVQGLLDLADLPYVGCGVLGSAVCMDKVIANFVLDAAGIARCAWDFMEAREIDDFDAIAARVEAKLSYPIFVKPANAGSSVGISKAHNKSELKAAVLLAAQHDDRIVFERFVDGQEVECAVRGNDVVTSTLPGEILASKDFYDYEDKYLAGTSRTAIPAQLSEEKLKEVQAAAVKAYRTLCCKGLARADFFVERGSGKVLINEINTLPGFTDISMYPKLMMAAGDTYASLLDSLLALALRRAEERHANA
ncbi:MAG: D-alanine--D-alanine ligase family protein [Ruthenibacterium sp.]